MSVKPGATVLVTGAAGLIGGWIVRQLHALGYRVIATDVVDGKPPGDLGSCVTGDICSEDFVDAVFSSHRPSAVVHCAGMLLFSCERDPGRAVAVNVNGTANLLGAAKGAGTSRFVMMSTSAVYGDQTSFLDESALVGPPHGLLGVYSATKWMAERLGLAERGSNGGPEFAAFRPGFVFGLGRPRSAGLSDVIQRTYGALLRGDAFEIAEASGSEVWHFVHVRDVCDAVVATLTAEQDPTGVYNIAGPADMYMSLEAFIAKVARASGKTPRGKLGGRASSGPRLDTSRLACKVGLETIYTVERAVEHDMRYLARAGVP